MLIGYEFDRHSLWEGNGPARLGAGPDHQIARSAILWAFWPSLAMVTSLGSPSREKATMSWPSGASDGAGPVGR